MERRNEHAGLPAHERAHLPRVLCIHPRLEVGPEEGGGRGDGVFGGARVAVITAGWGGEIGVGVGGRRLGRRGGRDVGRCGVVPILVLWGRGRGPERVCIVRHCS
jgi:hypothetical protein